MSRHRVAALAARGLRYSRNGRGGRTSVRDPRGEPMPEDSTRKLLRVFGVSMTQCEDALTALTQALAAAPTATASATAALEAYGAAARELAERWAEVSRLVLDYQVRAQRAVETYVRSGGASRP